MFCPCGKLLKPAQEEGKKILACQCGDFKKDLTGGVISQKVEEKKKIEIIEKVETLPKQAVHVESCPNKANECEAYYWTQQTRASDEPETRFFKCVKCEYSWREY